MRSKDERIVIHLKPNIVKNLNFIVDFSPIDINIEKFVDSLGDIDYVNEGARLEFGVNGEGIAAEIQAANMRKIGGPVRPEDGNQRR